MGDTNRGNAAIDLESRKARFASAHGIPLHSCATFRAWDLEADFMELYARVQPFTLVDHMRCHELWNFVSETAKIDGDILEVGVWRGGTGCVMAARAQMIGRTCDVFLCDTFQGVVKAGDNDPRYVGGEHADTNVDVVNKLLTENAVHNCIILPGIFPEETGQVIASRRFSMCHIDVDVYESARDVFNWVWPRMSSGGVVVFDDYGFEGCVGIAMLCSDLRPRQDLVFIHNLNGHAIFVKTKV